MTRISFEEANRLFFYDSTTGLMTRKVSLGRGKAGDLVGWLNTNGHLQVKVKKTSYLVHRLAWLCMTGEWPADDVDHRGTVKTNNKWENLRVVGNAINRQNQRAPHITNSLQMQGVTRCGNKYRARVGIDGKKIDAGLHETPELAHAAYVQLKRVMHVGCTI